MRFSFLFPFTLASFLCVPAFADDAPLKNEDLRKFIAGRTLNIERARDRATVRLDIKEDGTLYQNTMVSGRSPNSSAGKWTLNENGAKFCMEFQSAGSTGACFGVIVKPTETILFTGPGSNPTPWGRLIE